MVWKMRVLYPYCRHCSMSVKLEEQIKEDNIAKCKQCLHPLLLEAQFSSKSFLCPECGGEKSWQARRCKYCHRNMKVAADGRFKDNTEEFRNRLRKKVSEIADELKRRGVNKYGHPNYWKDDVEAHKNYKLCVGMKCYHTEGHRTMTTGTQQVIERIRGGEYQIGRGLEEGCDYTEAYAKHQVGWVTCRNSEAYAREFTCYQRPIEYNNGSCGAWWRSLPRRAGVPMGAN